MVDQAHLRGLYSELADAELRRLWRTELVSEARAVLQEEMTRRGITVPELPATAAEPPAKPRLRPFSNPYMPPAALLADPKVEAALSARGLVRLFQRLVIASTVIGIVLWVWLWLPLPISEDTMALRNVSGSDALDPMASWFLGIALQVVLLVCAFGLYFFRWWARWVFIATYALSMLNGLLGGTAVWLAWEELLIVLGTLMDGAIITLAFLPPLARYFEADRTAT